MKGLLFISVLCLTITVNISAQTTPQEMLNKAIYQEEVNGNLEEAIKLFSEIVDKNPIDRAITVEALYHLGLSNEKLGNEKAREYYEKIVTGFTDQPEYVRVARERLLKLKEVVAENKRDPKFHKIKFASNPDNGVLSPDGKKLAFMSDGGVWIVPLQGKVGQDIAGEPVRIADVPNLWEQSHLIEWSANGKWIAVYGGTVLQNENEGSVISVIPVGGDKSRLVQLPDQGAHLWSYKFSLSPDGEMLVFSALEPGKNRGEVLEPAKRLIFSIPTEGGVARQISSGWGNMPSFSPDGKFIVYIGYREKEEPREGDSRWNSDLCVAPFKGGTPVKLISEEGRLRSPIWSPDRRYIAALHEPGGTNYSAEIRIYPMSPDGLHAGIPEKITLPYSSWNMLPGWTPDNRLGVFIAKEEQFRIFTVPSSGGKAVQVTPDKEVPYYPRWSPDGTRIYFRGIDVEKRRIFPLFVPSSGGTPNEIKITSERGLVSCVPGGGQNISPDGKQILISAYQQPYDPEEGLDLWILPVNGGQAYRLTNDPSWERYPCWSTDGKQIAFKGQFKDSNNKECEAIFILPAKGGMVTQITTEKDSVGGGAIAFSPDGKQIAFFSEGGIKTIPLEGGETRIIVPDVKSESHSQLVYSPDGTKIAYSCGGKVWLKSLKGGESEELQTGLPDDAMLSEFDWSPDGRKIAFLASSGGEPEFWLISDFLPPEN